MTDWTLTLGLQNLRRQMDVTFPNRSRASDGTIGDAAHMAETSDHNPDDTAGSRAAYNDGDGKREVRAWDCTSDFGPGGPSAQQVVDHIRDLPAVSSVLRYMIYNRKIYQASHLWAAEPYTGASAHTEHIHFSGARSQAADGNTTFDYHLEALVDLTPANLAAIAKAVVTADILTAPPGSDPKNPTWSLESFVRNGYVESREAHKAANAALLAAGVDHADEAAIVAGVLAGLTPEVIAAAIPPGIAAAVAERLKLVVEEG